MDAKTRKYYDPEFKRNAADLYLNGKQSLAEITQSLGVPESTLYGWVIEFKKNGKESFKPKELSDHEKELLLLKKELADIRMERDILKKALAIFSQKK
jgi:transposase